MDKKLHIDQDYKVSYCIPLWVRDEQIKLSIKKIKDRLEPSIDKINEPIAIVCYGPSLNDTWEQVKNFKYIISCSGAHKFLLDREIIPTWHVEVDPRQHKTKLLGTPHKNVEYLISSTCHPDLFELLKNHNVKLWHVYDPKENSMRILPYNEWAISGGSSVGLRVMVIARFLGFTDLHVFGMDGCEGKGKQHAGEHPNQSPDSYELEHEGKTYYTNTSFLICAKQTFVELDKLPGVTAKFYGEGLVQDLANNYKPNPVSKDKAFIAISKPELISKNYLKLNQELYESNPLYGVGGSKHVDVVIQLSNGLNTRSILDYGCGRGYLGKALPFPIWEYDPIIPGKDESPWPADLVVCTDVLEHIEPDKIDFLLNDLKRCVLKMGYFVIDTQSSTKFLSDGSNAHLLQENSSWWYKKLSNYFEVDPNDILVDGRTIYVIVTPKKKEIKNE